MLLPSALSLSCESAATQSRYHPSSLFSSGPLSPSPSPSSTSVPTLYSTCRALQSMLTSPNQLPSPPTTHATIPSLPAHSSPFKLRLRAKKTDTLTTPTVTDIQLKIPSTPRRRIVKRAIPPPPAPRGPNKRRRSEDDGCEAATISELRSSEDGARQILTGDNSEEQFSLDQGNALNHLQDDDDVEEPTSISLPSTPKRLRLAPEILPLGLDRSNFRSLQLPRASSSLIDPENDNDNEENELDFDVWSTEDDRVLVELVLEKLKLTKSEWQDCAKSLGRDRKSVGRRWRSLMGIGEVGLKGLNGLGKGGSGRERNRGRVERRVGIHGSWR